MKLLNTRHVVLAVSLLLAGGLWLAGLAAWAAVLAGIVLLVFGADWLVEGAAALAHDLGVGSLVVGLTIVAFGTSAPELAASIGATLREEGPVAIGNVIGSNIANVCLVLGLTAMMRPVHCDSQVVRRDVPVMIVATLVGMGAFLGGEIARWEGAVLAAGIVVYVLVLYVLARQERPEVRQAIEGQLEELLQTGGPAEGRPSRGRRRLTQVGLIVLGGGALYLGSVLLVDGAVTLAEAVGVSSSVIGLSLVAFGTSVPELVTSFTAAFKKEADIAVGNIVGSNIFNILTVLGISALVDPIIVPAESVRRDMWVMLAVALATFPIMLTRGRISRLEGLLLFGGYCGYMLWIFLRS